MQLTWNEKLDWDEPLPENIERSWCQWIQELDQLSKIPVQRCLHEDSDVHDISIHTFCDAAEHAYATVAYTRYEYSNGAVDVRLIAAKMRLAPLKGVSIPRLELMAAVIGCRLTAKISEALDIPMKKATLWTDSYNTLFWIKNQSRKFMQFVANRVGEIHSATSPEQWRYVNTKENPADHATRPNESALALKDDQLWWSGPAFLEKPKEEWPEWNIQEPDSTALLEMKKDFLKKEDCHTTIEEEEGQISSARLNPRRYSKWYSTEEKIGLSLVRVRAWVQRAVTIWKTYRRLRERRHSKKTVADIEELKPEELIHSEMRIIEEDQKSSFPLEWNQLKDNKPILMSSPIYKLTPLLSTEDGNIKVMRYYTRLQRGADISRDVKLPIVLHRRSWVAKLITRYYHETEGHNFGVNYLMNSLRERFWIPHVRELIKEVLRECTTCKLKFKLKNAAQQMGPLPPFRITKTLQAFSDCAVDYGGPYLTIQGRGKTRTKRYLCLFVCLQTRAVHLEMAYSLETDGFLKALQRMVARRGWPRRIISDNGTNFIGACRVLKRLTNLDVRRIERETSPFKIQWEWNPPRAPHFGGVFEAMIKSAKRAISAVLSNADINDEELSTTFICVENLLNSRPLTATSSDPFDETPITPNHFLMGRVGKDIHIEDDIKIHHPQKRWYRVRQLVRQTWDSWHHEFVPYLGSRSKWISPKRNMQPDDLVLVIEPTETKRGWRLGKILKTYPGVDGLVRKVDVRVQGQVLYNRAINNLCPLEFESESDAEKTKDCDEPFRRRSHGGGMWSREISTRE